MTHSYSQDLATTLAMVTYELRSIMLVGNPDFTFGPEIALPYILHDEVIVVPPYNDGFQGFQTVMLWFEIGGDVRELTAKNVYGQVQKVGVDLEELGLIRWALVV